jgi:ubiquinone biosynthesis protein
MGRVLDPDLDLWKTAKPHLERWVSEQVGWRGLIDKLKAEAPRYSHILPQLPRLTHQALTALGERDQTTNTLLRELAEEQRRTNRMLSFFVYFVGAFVAGAIGFQAWLRWQGAL